MLNNRDLHKTTRVCSGEVEKLSSEDMKERCEALMELDNQAIAESGMLCALEKQGYGNSTCCLECKHNSYCWQQD